MPRKALNSHRLSINDSLADAVENLLLSQRLIVTS